MTLGLEIENPFLSEYDDDEPVPYTPSLTDSDTYSYSDPESVPSTSSSSSSSCHSSLTVSPASSSPTSSPSSYYYTPPKYTSQFRFDIPIIVVTPGSPRLLGPFLSDAESDEVLYHHKEITADEIRRSDFPPYCQNCRAPNTRLVGGGVSRGRPRSSSTSAVFSGNDEDDDGDDGDFGTGRDRRRSRNTSHHDSCIDSDDSLRDSEDSDSSDDVEEYTAPRLLPELDQGYNDLKRVCSHDDGSGYSVIAVGKPLPSPTSPTIGGFKKWKHRRPAPPPPTHLPKRGLGKRGDEESKVKRGLRSLKMIVTA